MASLGPAHQRQIPHLYSAAQVRQLLARGSQLRGRVRPLSYKTLLGLLACTGLRISKALALEVGDVDLKQGHILVRESKYHHRRWVPLHPTVLHPCGIMIAAAESFFPYSALFASDRGRRFSYTTVRVVFRKLADGLKSNGARPLVRLDDLRHAFGCRVLLHWQHSARGTGDRPASDLPLSGAQCR